MSSSLKEIEIFLTVCRLGSLSAAANFLNINISTLSVAVKRLEASLSAPLFIRSTRHLRLTEEGLIYKEHCEKAWEILKEGEKAISANNSASIDKLTLSAPSDFGRNKLVPWLNEFKEMHPMIEIRLFLSDYLADVYKQPVDLMLRYGSPKDSNLIVLPINTENDRVLCASASYLAQHGHPASPHDLSQHSSLCIFLNGTVHNHWAFQKADGEHASVHVNAKYVSDDGDVVRRWLLAGKGIAYKSRIDIQAHINTGELVELCKDWSGERAPLNLMCSTKNRLNETIRSFRAFLTQKVKEELTAGR